MLTRLTVHGFKNLVDVDLRFGSFTCIAGTNGVGKSNLFDAITFFGSLADKTFVDAARGVRDEQGRTTELRSLFTKTRDGAREEMSFTAEMVVPRESEDDLGQSAEASITFLRYSVTLGYASAAGLAATERLTLVDEKLAHINIGDAKDALGFTHSKEWRDTAVTGARRGGDFISTGPRSPEGDGEKVVRLHQDGNQGRPKTVLAENLPRTVLSSVTASESPTAMAARSELRSWRLFQLEPTALRRPDPFAAAARIAADGSHLPATLHRLASTPQSSQEGADPGRVYASVANRLSELVENIRSIAVDIDSKRELLTLELIDRYGTQHSARALSDGTLRFLALAILEADSEASGVVCLEEPENGIHPERISAMLTLLQDIALDPREPVADDNPLRQVIINTHSPSVVGKVSDEDLVLARSAKQVCQGAEAIGVTFAPIKGSWRNKAGFEGRTVTRGELDAYLDPHGDPDLSLDSPTSGGTPVAEKFRERLLFPIEGETA